MKYGMWTFGQIEALLNKIGEDNARKLLDCRQVKVTLDTDDSLAAITADPTHFMVWKTITIGNLSRDKFIPSLKERGMNVSDWSADMMKQDAFTLRFASKAHFYLRKCKY